MSDTIITAIISAAATIIVALLGKFGTITVRSRGYRSYRDKKNIPQIMGTIWSAQWFYEDKSLYVQDTVKFEKWEKNIEFSGYGEMMSGNNLYKYPIKGTVAPSGIVVLSYEAQHFPTEGNIGVACLELSNGTHELRGLWAGRCSKKLDDGNWVNLIRGGKVEMKRLVV